MQVYQRREVQVERLGIVKVFAVFVEGLGEDGIEFLVVGHFVVVEDGSLVARYAGLGIVRREIFQAGIVEGQQFLNISVLFRPAGRFDLMLEDFLPIGEVGLVDPRTVLVHHFPGGICGLVVLYFGVFGIDGKIGHAFRILGLTEGHSDSPEDGNDPCVKFLFHLVTYFEGFKIQ